MDDICHWVDNGIVVIATGALDIDHPVNEKFRLNHKDFYDAYLHVSL